MADDQLNNIPQDPSASARALNEFSGKRWDDVSSQNPTEAAPREPVGCQEWNQSHILCPTAQANRATLSLG